jgi:hypothetical protein
MARTLGRRDVGKNFPNPAYKKPIAPLFPSSFRLGLPKITQNTKRGQPHTANPLILLARLEGFEPPTHGLEVRCSIRLSYRRANDGQVHNTPPWACQAACRDV